MRTKYLTALLLLSVFWLGTAGALGQISSSSYTVKAGHLIDGGGLSSSSSYNLGGSVPFLPAGVSNSSGFLLKGGVTGAIYGTLAGFSVTYSGDATITLTAGSNYPVQILITSGSGADTSGTFYYRMGGQSSYSTAAMTKGAGQLNYTVPGTQLGIRGMEYYFKIKIGGDSIYIGSSANPYIFVSNLTDDQAQRPSAMPEASYRIVGVPLSFSARQTVVNVFLDDLGAVDKKQWRLGSYANGIVTEYPDAADVTPGRGYWLIARGGKRYGAAGFSMRPNASIGPDRFYRISLDTGWVQIANPLPFNVAWGDIRFDTAGTLVPGHPSEVLNDIAYAYNGSSYASATTIGAWDGVFIHINRPGVRIYFPYSESGTMAPRQLAEQVPYKPSPQAWSVQLSVETNGRIDNGNFAGTAPGANSGLDDYDFFEPPQAPEAPCLAFVLPEGDNGLFRTDIRPATPDGDIWRLKILPGSGRILKVAGMKNIPQDMSGLLELSDGSIIQLKQDISINLPDNVTSGRLLIGTEKFLAGQERQVLPSTYTLFQNYPNPFNPATTIKFALPQNGMVNLEIYNVLGQKVRTLLDEELPAGFHSVTWDGRDGSGQEAATGVYFYRLKAGDFREIKKMLMLK
ncbi:hypothetical protein TRIP_C20969 [Candidatus Zixiibacteriota bacterium]|nr:hypothetical protein TRIP_C20969 [candidate division Zixibacteria bacterium]